MSTHANSPQRDSALSSRSSWNSKNLFLINQIALRKLPSMHVKSDAITPLAHAITRSATSLSEDELSRLSVAVWARLSDRIEWGEILAEAAHGTTDEAYAAIRAALTTSGEGLSLAEKRLFQEFQTIAITAPEQLLWNPFTNTLIVDDHEYRVPQPILAIEGHLAEMCPDLTPPEVDQVQSCIRGNTGPWNYYGQVERFERQGSRIWAVNDVSERLAPIVSFQTASEFMELHRAEIEKLHPETQKTIAFAVSLHNDLLLDRGITPSFSAEDAHPALAVVSFVDDGEREEIVFTRSQTSEEFLEAARHDTFNFDLSQQTIREELIEHIQFNEGPWNQLGLVHDFFVSNKGAVLCRLYNGKTIFIPISMPAGDFMTTFVDENPAITSSGKSLLNRVVEMEDLKIIRGSVSSISGSAEDGVLVRGYKGRIAGAFFSPCDTPERYFMDDPLLSDRGKEALQRDLEENPASPEWRLRGYARRFSETKRGVLIEHYDGTRRFVPFDTHE